MALFPLRIPEEPIMEVVVGLMAILVAVLVLPMVSKRVEENLEPFFLLMGIIGFTLIWSYGIIPDISVAREIVLYAMKSPVSIAGLPIGITQVVLIAGLVFYYQHRRIYRGVFAILKRLGLPIFIFIIVTVLGLASSIISVIVSAVILSEILAGIPLDRRRKVEFTVLACFALGLGAALTPVGEPLSTIAVSKLSGPPYHAGFTFLFELLGIYIIPGVIALAAYTALRISRRGLTGVVDVEEIHYTETLRSVVWRAIKVYMFVAALELLGTSFLPLVEWYFTKIPPYVLYWVNMVSAVLDNATLTAAEIGPSLTIAQIKSALIALLISGGMLIPGNIPNIIAAGRLKITSKEWARVGVPTGVVLLAIYFIILVLEGSITF